jgi:hypothetical protein
VVSEHESDETAGRAGPIEFVPGLAYSWRAELRCLARRTGRGKEGGKGDQVTEGVLTGAATQGRWRNNRCPHSLRR